MVGDALPRICMAACQNYKAASEDVRPTDYCRVDGHQADPGTACRHYRDDSRDAHVSPPVEMYDGVPEGFRILTQLSVVDMAKSPDEAIQRIVGQLRRKGAGSGNLDDTI